MQPISKVNANSQYFIYLSSSFVLDFIDLGYLSTLNLNNYIAIQAYCAISMAIKIFFVENFSLRNTMTDQDKYVKKNIVDQSKKIKKFDFFDFSSGFLDVEFIKIRKGEKCINHDDFSKKNFLLNEGKHLENRGDMQLKKIKRKSFLCKGYLKEGISNLNRIIRLHVRNNFNSNSNLIFKQQEIVQNKTSHQNSSKILKNIIKSYQFLKDFSMEKFKKKKNSQNDFFRLQQFGNKNTLISMIPIGIRNNIIRENAEIIKNGDQLQFFSERVLKNFQETYSFKCNKSFKPSLVVEYKGLEKNSPVKFKKNFVFYGAKSIQNKILLVFITYLSSLVSWRHFWTRGMVLSKIGNLLMADSPMNQIESRTYSTENHSKNNIEINQVDFNLSSISCASNEFLQSKTKSKKSGGKSSFLMQWILRNLKIRFEIKFRIEMVMKKLSLLFFHLARAKIITHKVEKLDLLLRNLFEIQKKTNFEHIKIIIQNLMASKMKCELEILNFGKKSSKEDTTVAKTNSKELYKSTRKEFVENRIARLEKALRCRNMKDNNSLFFILRKKINCPIEVNNQKDVILISCGHLFSFRCIQNLITSRNRKCPICSRKFSKGQILPIYL